MGNINILKENFLKDINLLKTNNDFVKLKTELGNEYFEMLTETWGDEILETGKSMLNYLFDLLNKDINLGLSTFNIIFSGYQDIKYSDIFTPYYDSLTTRRLWVLSTKKYDLSDHYNNSLIFNTYFRWYASTFELFRKMLIFDCFCLGQFTERPINVKNYLFSMQDPIKKLKSESSANRQPLFTFYNSTIRHSIAHGNIVIIPNKGIFIRETNENNSEIIQTKYGLNPEDFINSVSKNIEIMYSSVRLFFYITINYLFTKHIKLFELYINQSVFRDEVFISMIQSIQQDTENVVY